MEEMMFFEQWYQTVLLQGDTEKFHKNAQPYIEKYAKELNRECIPLSTVMIYLWATRYGREIIENILEEYYLDYVMEYAAEEMAAEMAARSKQ